MRPSTLILAAAFSAALSTTVLAADPVTLVGWDFTALEEVRTEVAPDFAVDGLQVSSISVGSGVETLTSSSTKRFGGRNFVDGSYDDAVGNDRYFVFTVTVKPGYKASFNQIDKFKITRTKESGPSCGSWEYRISSGDYESFYSLKDVTFGEKTENPIRLPDNLSNLQGGTSIEFRFVLWNASKDTGTFAFNDGKSGTYDIAISGTCEPIIDGDVTYPLTFDVSGGVLSSTNGIPVASSATSPLDIPARIPVVFTADEGKRLVSVTTNDVAIANIDKSASSYTFVMVDGDASVEVVFATPPALTYTIEGGIASVNGEAISSPANLPAGTVVTFTADAGKKLSSVSIGGTPVEDIDTSATSYAYTMGDEEASLAVVFVEPPVDDRPWFTETFEGDSRGIYSESTVNEIVASWHGTNFMVQGTEKDVFNGTKALRFQGKAAYIEMATDKTNGVGSIKFMAGSYKGDSVLNSAFWLSISTDRGKTWTAWQSEKTPLATTDFQSYEFSNVNIPGKVRLRIDYETSTKDRRLNIDDIEITDFVTETATSLDVCTGKSIVENFDSMYPEASSDLPAPWRVGTSSDLRATILPYANADSATMLYAGIGESISTGGVYNFGDGSRDQAADRAVGFLSTSEKFRTCALMVPVRNTGASTIGGFRISYSVEKYRCGKNAKTVALYTSVDGENWEAAGESFAVDFKGDNTNDACDTVVSTPVKGILHKRLEPGHTIYLAWFYNVPVSATGANAQALAIDDVKIQAGFRTVFMVR